MSRAFEHKVLPSRKRKLKEDVAVLELVLDPPSVAVKKRRLRACPCLRVSCDNYLVGIINGVRCNVQLDTGSTITVLFWSLARMLGLITGRETTTPLKTELWSGTTTMQVVQLKSITIDLGGGVVVVTPATIFPQWMELHYNPWDVVLDAHQMRRGRMVQVFRPDGGELYVRKPDQLRRTVRKTKQSMEVDVMRVKLARPGKRETMSMLVDTGAHGMYVSSKRRDGAAELPKRVVIDVGDGCCLHAEPLKEVASNDTDFITGIDLLAKYRAELDYAQHTITFWADSLRRRATMRTNTSDLHGGDTQRQKTE
ncbi:hypothetical protein E2C01_047262 [Portunus trituberculatus]|uniref:Peptidase A2 domain-containing protein n=1 Tax=Portunus trituberculatus TaxID=210409 RepID=A0A5B7G830_PORTR|nr:hypothetical protein [Portunus trituberculatus]